MTFQLPLGDLSAPVALRRAGPHARASRPGDRAPTTEVRDAVLGLRRGKGMVLDEADHDTWSAGSFFTNPFVDDAAQLPEGAPRWQQPDGTVKTSAAWLIEHAGFAKGYGNDTVALSGKHTLALTNRGSARTEDLLALASEVQAGVHARLRHLAGQRADPGRLLAARSGLSRTVSTSSGCCSTVPMIASTRKPTRQQQAEAEQHRADDAEDVAGLGRATTAQPALRGVDLVDGPLARSATRTAR